MSTKASDLAPHELAMGGPSHEVIELGNAIIGAKQSPRAVDVGAGLGRNSLFLSTIGFDVTALEKDPRLADQAKRAAVDTGSFFRSVCSGVEEFAPNGHYDLCLLLGILHFLPNPVARQAVDGLKAVTSPGGVHAITISHDPSRRYDNTLVAQKHLNSFGPDDVAASYSDWHVVSHERYVKRDNHLHGTIDVHPIEKFVIAKPAHDRPLLVQAMRTKLTARPDQTCIEAALFQDRLEHTTLRDLRRSFGPEDLVCQLSTPKPQLTLLASAPRNFCLTIAFWGTSKCYIENEILVGHASYETPFFHRYCPLAANFIQ